VDFNSRIFLFKIDPGDSRFQNKPVQFGQQAFPGFTPHIGKVNFRRLHFSPLSARTLIELLETEVSEQL
jgi:hypothetical protein